MRSLQKMMAGLLMVSGLLLLFTASSYYGYGFIARSNLDALSFVSERPLGLGPVSVPQVVDSVLPIMGVPTLRTPAESPRASSSIQNVKVQRSDSTVSGETGVTLDNPGEIRIDSADQVDIVEADEPESNHHVASEESSPGDYLAQISGGSLGSRTEAVGVSDLNRSQGQAVSQVGEATGDVVLKEQPNDEGRSDSTAPIPEAATTSVDELSESLGAERETISLSPNSDGEPEVEELTFLVPEVSLLPGNPSAASRIKIPAINVDSEVTELGLAFTDKGYAWETPKNIVGHVPTTARPGTQGLGWYFGHLESPIRREGNIFRRLPEIPELLEKYTLHGGEPVHIVIESQDRSYLYQVYKAETVSQDDLHLTDSGNFDITLVSCVPRLYYDHRLLVTAALIDVSES